MMANSHHQPPTMGLGQQQQQSQQQQQIVSGGGGGGAPMYLQDGSGQQQPIMSSQHLQQQQQQQYQPSQHLHQQQASASHLQQHQQPQPGHHSSRSSQMYASGPNPASGSQHQSSHLHGHRGSSLSQHHYGGTGSGSHHRSVNMMHQHRSSAAAISDPMMASTITDHLASAGGPLTGSGGALNQIGQHQAHQQQQHHGAPYPTSGYPGYSSSSAAAAATGAVGDPMLSGGGGGGGSSYRNTIWDSSASGLGAGYEGGASAPPLHEHAHHAHAQASGPYGHQHQSRYEAHYSANPSALGSSRRQHHSADGLGFGGGGGASGFGQYQHQQTAGAYPTGGSSQYLPQVGLDYGGGASAMGLGSGSRSRPPPAPLAPPMGPLGYQSQAAHLQQQHHQQQQQQQAQQHQLPYAYGAGGGGGGLNETGPVSGACVTELRARLQELQVSYANVKRELEMVTQKLGSSMHSIKSFWSPELKKERALRKEEQTKYALINDQMKMMRVEVQKQALLIRQLEDELRLAHETSRIRITDPDIQQHLDALCMEKENLFKENCLLRDTIRELEMRIETQKQTLAARDDSIRKMVEMMNNKGLSSKIMEDERIEMDRIKTRNIELEARLRQYETIFASKEKEIIKMEELRAQLARRDQEMLTMSAKMKSLEDQQHDSERRILVLKDSLMAREEHYNLLLANVEELRRNLDERNKLINRRSYQQTFGGGGGSGSGSGSQQLGANSKQQIGDLQQELGDMQSLLEMRDKRITELQRKLIQLENLLAEREAHLERARMRLEHSSGVAGGSSSAGAGAYQDVALLNHLEETLGDKEKQIALLRDQRDRAEHELNEERDSHERSIKEYTIKLNSIKFEMEKLQDEMANLQAQQDKSGQSLQAKQTELQKYQEQLEEREKALEAKRQELTNVSKQIQQQQQQQQAAGNQAPNQQQQQQQQEMIAKLQVQIKNLEEERNKLRGELERVRNELKQTQAELERLLKILTASEDEKFNLTQQIDQLQAKLKSMPQQQQHQQAQQQQQQQQRPQQGPGQGPAGQQQARGPPPQPGQPQQQGPRQPAPNQQQQQQQRPPVAQQQQQQQPQQKPPAQGQSSPLNLSIRDNIDLLETALRHSFASWSVGKQQSAASGARNETKPAPIVSGGGNVAMTREKELQDDAQIRALVTHFKIELNHLMGLKWSQDNLDTTGMSSPSLTIDDDDDEEEEDDDDEEDDDEDYSFSDERDSLDTCTTDNADRMQSLRGRRTGPSGQRKGQKQGQRRGEDQRHFMARSAEPTIELSGKYSGVYNINGMEPTDEDEYEEESQHGGVGGPDFGRLTGGGGTRHKSSGAGLRRGVAPIKAGHQVDDDGYRSLSRASTTATASDSQGPRVKRSGSGSGSGSRLVELLKQLNDIKARVIDLIDELDQIVGPKLSEDDLEAYRRRRDTLVDKLDALIEAQKSSSASASVSVSGSGSGSFSSASLVAEQQPIKLSRAKRDCKNLKSEVNSCHSKTVKVNRTDSGTSPTLEQSVANSGKVRAAASAPGGAGQDTNSAASDSCEEQVQVIDYDFNRRASDLSEIKRYHETARPVRQNPSQQQPEARQLVSNSGHSSAQTDLSQSNSSPSGPIGATMTGPIVRIDTSSRQYNAQPAIDFGAMMRDYEQNKLKQQQQKQTIRDGDKQTFHLDSSSSGSSFI